MTPEERQITNQITMNNINIERHKACIIRIRTGLTQLQERNHLLQERLFMLQRGRIPITQLKPVKERKARIVSVNPIKELERFLGPEGIERAKAIGWGPWAPEGVGG